MLSDKDAAKRKIVQLVVNIFYYILLIGLSFIILYPFIVKISAMFMSENDAVNPTVSMIPKEPTLDAIFYVLNKTSFFRSFINTVIISFLCGILTVVSSCLVGYGLARFQLKGEKIVLGLIVFSILVPPQTILIPMFSYFRFFDFAGIFSLLGIPSINMTDSVMPVIIMNLLGFGFREGLFILLARQYYKGLPDELSEASEVDGAGIMKTFLSIFLPLSKTIAVTIFIISFSWQYTDTFYSTVFYNHFSVLVNQVLMIATKTYLHTYFNTIYGSAAVIMAILPLLIIFVFLQKKIVQGIESSGIVG